MRSSRVTDYLNFENSIEHKKSMIEYKRKEFYAQSMYTRAVYDEPSETWRTAGFNVEQKVCAHVDGEIQAERQIKLKEAKEKEFYAFVHTLSEGEYHAIYDFYVNQDNDALTKDLKRKVKAVVKDIEDRLNFLYGGRMEVIKRREGKK